MEIRYATNPSDIGQCSAERLRKEFLVENLFVPGEIQMVYSHYDRFIVGSAVPTKDRLNLGTDESLKAAYFLARRELGIVNIGFPGIVTVDGTEYVLACKDALYVGLGNKDVTFQSKDPSHPAKFYLLSSLAHKAYPVQKVTLVQAEHEQLGLDSQSNKRTINRFVYKNGIQSCQLMFGLTMLEPNSMWNTMPAHLHDRRMEVYLYFDMPEEARVWHIMGEPNETRHIVVKSEEAVISPPWSIHSGVGTNNYCFIWAMAGENYTFNDQDFIPMDALR